MSWKGQSNHALFFNAYAYLWNRRRNSRSFWLPAWPKAPLISSSMAIPFGRRVSDALPWCCDCLVMGSRSTATRQGLQSHLALQATAPAVFGMKSQETGGLGESPNEMGETPLVLRLLLRLRVRRNPVAQPQFFQHAEQDWSTWKRSGNLARCLMNLGEPCVGNSCMMIFQDHGQTSVA